ncbi:MAG: sugar phosphate isomerase/epimerase [Pirellulales bacterium]|nr:sugar phosphate isomerase/epimerase [Pirellulales bacterium]
MIKNFSAQALGINGRQSELIELALTYAFSGMDIDMTEMLRRAQRTSSEDAAKYLNAAKIQIGGFELDVSLDADDETFTSQVGTLHPIADLAKELGAQRCYVRLPAATDRLPYHEYFETQRSRLSQVAQALAPREIKLGVGFSAGKELEEGRQFPFVRNVEGFIAMVGSMTESNIGYLIDTWDWVVGDGAMDQLSELPAEKIVAVRLASVPQDIDQTKAVTSDRVLPEQEGTLNHVKLIKHLSSIGFDGPVSPGASSSQYKGQTRESIVQRAQEAVDGISKEAGLHVAPLPMDLIEDIPYEPNPVN